MAALAVLYQKASGNCGYPLRQRHTNKVRQTPHPFIEIQMFAVVD
jgi:hypothetical protein